MAAKTAGVIIGTKDNETFEVIAGPDKTRLELREVWQGLRSKEGNAEGYRQVIWLKDGERKNVSPAGKTRGSATQTNADGEKLVELLQAAEKADTDLIASASLSVEGEWSAAKQQKVEVAKQAARKAAADARQAVDDFRKEIADKMIETNAPPKKEAAPEKKPAATTAKKAAKKKDKTPAADKTVGGMEDVV